ncbi:MAG: multifunctional oxoglutarate decarboxylase/oxoglutarate dehydrogenase thiamine pyrophosphate-binding subunit/dihydrolipoyllysine-residue succinyltransferase subunit [Terriglobales bacterium]
MPSTTESDPEILAFLESLGPNEGYAAELYQAYRSNRQSVPERWRATFDDLLQRLGRNGADGTAASGAGAPPPEELPVVEPIEVAPAVPAVSPTPPAAHATGAPAVPAPRPAPGPWPTPQADDRTEPMRGGAARLAANMIASLSVPTATSQRTIPARLLEENRQILNRHLGERGQKLSYTPLLGWVLVRALQEFPNVNSAYTEAEGGAARLARGHISLGLAVDLEAKGGGRQLLVPVVKRADTLDFASFLTECERVIRGARNGKLSPDDLQGATISLTNPGTLGTRASVPRLMPGQGAIIAAGAMAYPPGFEAVAESALDELGIGKTLTLACTYDHRVVQGAESGAFLARMEQLLLGQDGFYDDVFHSLGAPLQPARWTPAVTPAAGSRRHDDAEVRRLAAVFQLVHAYRVRGHLLADTDPLEFHPITHPELDPAFYGLSLWDLDRRFLSPGGERGTERMLPLREILTNLQATYCGKLACEFMHIQALEQRQWLTGHMEPSRNAWPLPPELRRHILEQLTRAEQFERLLHTRYVGHKRFSLEGGEALIPALHRLCELAIEAGMREALIGMSHRGRLNVLTNIVGQGMNAIFSKFEDADPDSVEGSGDVKYHVGAQGWFRGADGRPLEVGVSSNPSHLEAVDPVLEGEARARQEALQDTPKGRLVLPVLIHGDAAFAGQGVVAETLNLSQLEGYRTGGTVHIVVNNRIGFTTSPADARSTLYSTDVARMVQAPIWHVNGDDPEAVVRAIQLAFAFRQEFHRDVVVDLVCYRRHGHNEGDDPSLTLPVLYRNIHQHPPVRQLYAERLAAEGLVSAPQAEEMAAEIRRQFAESPANGQEHAPAAAAAPAAVATSATEADLTAVAEALGHLPVGFHLHPKLERQVQRRVDAVRQHDAVDWSLAEALAFGTLLRAGVPVRLTGQDTGRGTFSQRHAVLFDYQTGAPYVPLQHVSGAQAAFAVHDSLLSEEAALGFEFGYALKSPQALVLWEAQFGDFANGAQVVTDQFVSVSAAKWGQPSGLVLLLPHGYEGQGPEHSSARMERFLQLAAEDNLIIANCTTAAQYFHLLRLQALAARVAPAARRPLILFTPKSLLRHPDVASPLAEFTRGGFHPVLGDPGAGARRVVFCCGKLYYDLVKGRAEQKSNAAIVRVERLYPFPAAELQAALEPHAAATAWIWAQEEPANMGPWRYMQAELGALLGRDRPLAYAGREAAASPASGSLRRHQKEQSAVVSAALGAGH